MHIFSVCLWALSQKTEVRFSGKRDKTGSFIKNGIFRELRVHFDILNGLNEMPDKNLPNMHISSPFRFGLLCQK